MAAGEQRAWLFGPAPDLLLGAGLLYLLGAPALWASGPALQSAQPTWLIPWLVIIFSGAHYGGTLLRVYENERERRAYRLFTVYATLLVVGALLGALHYPFAGSMLITVYLTWSPWHYTGQNYGIAVMFLRRRGVDVTPAAKRWLYASFLLSFASVFLNFHFAGGISQGDPLGYSSSTSSGFEFLSLSLPGSVRTVLFPIVGVAYAASILISGTLLLRRGSLRAIAPAALLVATQALWFSVPHIALFSDLGSRIPAIDLSSPSGFQFYFFWAALGHSVQYLWITAYYARSERRWRGHWNYLLKVFVFGNAVWAAPVLFFGPQMLGRPDYDNGLAICVAAAVNIHHFILDGAIWKLRNPRISGILIRSQPSEVDAPEADRPSWARRFGWAYASLCCAAMVAGLVEIRTRLPNAFQRGDYDGVASILDRAALYGRDSGFLRGQLANALIQREDPAGAARQFWRSLVLSPQADGYLKLGSLYEIYDDDDAAVATWQRGLGVFPESFELLHAVGMKFVRTGSPEQALPYLRRAAATRPGDPKIQATVDRVARMAGS